MRVTQQGVFFVLVILVASEFNVQEQDGMSLTGATYRNSSAFLTDHEGEMYRKPKGNCKLDAHGKVIGCECYSRLLRFVKDSKKGKLRGVVCMKRCIGTVYCPDIKNSTEKYTKSCIDFKGYRNCGLVCEKKKDCLQGAYCQSFPQPTGGMCMYTP